MNGDKPSEYYIVWEESLDVGSLTWATRLARQKAAEGKGAVQVRQRVGLTACRNEDGVTYWTHEDDVCVSDAFGVQEEGARGR